MAKDVVLALIWVRFPFLVIDLHRLTASLMAYDHSNVCQVGSVRVNRPSFSGRNELCAVGEGTVKENRLPDRQSVISSCRSWSTGWIEKGHLPEYIVISD